MVETKFQNLTEDEAALYDRQIRLWGLDAQKRLRGAKILVAGCCGLGAEVIKNLVLSGVQSLTILDHREMTKLDTCSNFLGPHECIGQNIATSSVQRAQALNPMVEVSADSESLADKSDNYFKQFSVIVVSRATREQMIRINNLCRQEDILFYSGDVYGMYGYMFADLNEHSYVEEVKEKSAVLVNGVKQITEDTKMVKKVESFVPFSAALDVDWSSERYANRLRRTSHAYFIMQSIFEFEFIHQRKPQLETKEQDVVELLTIKNCLLQRLNVPDNKVSNDYAQDVFGQVSPVCAIVGGVLAQEVIKAVSQKDIPHNNFFFFHPELCGGVIENIGQ